MTVWTADASSWLEQAYYSNSGRRHYWYRYSCIASQHTGLDPQALCTLRWNAFGSRHMIVVLVVGRRRCPFQGHEL